MDTNFCSDTTIDDNSQLIGQDGIGNAFAQIPVRDENDNTPYFNAIYNDSAIFSVYEHIKNDLIQLDQSKEVSASDEDRCWYGNGLITFRAIVSEGNTALNDYFVASGGHCEYENENCQLPMGRNDCAENAVADIALGEQQIYREKLSNNQYNKVENLYKLSILARGEFNVFTSILISI